VVECLLCKSEALSSNPSPTKKKKNPKKQKICFIVAEAGGTWHVETEVGGGVPVSSTHKGPFKLTYRQSI
jgi:hypothetical protein